MGSQDVSTELNALLLERKEDHFLQTHGVTLTLPLGRSGTAMVAWLVAHKTKVTLTVTGEIQKGATGAR